ncbi:hypothetical protein ACHWQZ_G002164 [Mnemiopsis leidyi]
MTEKDDPGEGTNEIPSRESVVARKSMSGEMAMPSLQMSGVALNVLSKQGLRRSSMFESHGKMKHGTSETYSRGSFSLKGVIDPAVGLVGPSGKIDRLSDVSDVPKELIRQTESKDSIESRRSRRKKTVPQFENSYRLDPSRKPTRKELSNLFERVLEDIPSDKASSKDFRVTVRLGQDLADKVIAECHNLELSRYRFLCLSTVINREGTSAYQASRPLFDKDRDTWEEASVKLAYANIYLQLYCVYLD